MPTQNPTTSNQRIAAIDGLRGFALLGIVIVNAMFFALPLTFSDTADLGSMSILDQCARMSVMMFAEGKFISIFSMLFGAGLAIQYQSAINANKEFYPFVYRRLAVLAVFGLAHAIFLWYGDILFIYACIGSLVVLGISGSTKQLLRASLILLVIGTLILTFVVTSFGTEAQDYTPMEQKFGIAAIEATEVNPDHPMYVAAETAAHTDGPFLDALAFRLTHYMIVLTLVFVMCWTVAGMFCLGAALWKSGFLNGNGPGAEWRTTGIWCGFLIGLPLEMMQAYVIQYSSSPILITCGFAMHALSGPLLALGTVSLFVVLTEKKRLPGIGYLAAVGRMSLTAYLLESVLFVFITDWWGLGLFGRMGYAELLLVAVIVYVVVVLLCVAWQKFFRMGPMEWLWRSISYLRVKA